MDTHAYQGEMIGVVYRSNQSHIKAENHYAAQYRCAMCPNPATVWDHCHTHGYIRGPLCRSCNHKEPDAFAMKWMEGVRSQVVIVRYYWNCSSCETLRMVTPSLAIRIAQSKSKTILALFAEGRKLNAIA